MATKKKPKKKRASSKAAGKRVIAAKRTVKKKPAARRKPLRKKGTNQAKRKKRTLTTKATERKAGSAKIQSGRKKKARGKGQPIVTASFSSASPRARRGSQSGDLQGLSRIEGANSESVDELIEEGNAFEADVVEGVEDADSADEAEVHTHEVPEDDVPEEYLDKDK
jgi:hypothetical protein